MSIPKAVLYYQPGSIWSTAVHLALAEKGYGDDELDSKVVEIWKAENLSLSYLRINPKGTVPSLVVPLAKTLAPDEDHLYKALTDTKSILEFLDKSRSSTSPTRTTSTAPAPRLAPATVTLSDTGNSLITLLHAEDLKAFYFSFFSALTPQALPTIAARYLDKISWLSNTLGELLSASAPITGDTTTTTAAAAAEQGENGTDESQRTRASERTRAQWQARKSFLDQVEGVVAAAHKADDELSAEQKAQREAYFAESRNVWAVKVPAVLQALDRDMIGPFALGDQLSLVDLHICPWLAQIAFLCGGTPDDSGETLVSKIEAHVRLAKGNSDDDFALSRTFETHLSPEVRATGMADSLSMTGMAPPTAGAGQESKLGAFWDEMRARQSWKAVYSTSLEHLTRIGGARAE